MPAELGGDLSTAGLGLYGTQPGGRSPQRALHAGKRGRARRSDRPWLGHRFTRHEGLRRSDRVRISDASPSPATARAVPPRPGGAGGRLVEPVRHLGGDLLRGAQAAQFRGQMGLEVEARLRTGEEFGRRVTAETFPASVRAVKPPSGRQEATKSASVTGASSIGRCNSPVLQRPIELAQYASKEFAQVCTDLGVIRSRGAVGTSADNAAAESFNATMKRETLQGRKHWPGARAARLAVFRWATRYNTRRRHSSIGQISPNSFEQRSVTLATAA